MRNTQVPQRNVLVPTTAGERHALVDVLRGLALFGILVVNLEFIAVAPFEGWTDPASWWDRAGAWIAITFFQLKSFIVFALLFGYGVALMARRPGPGFRTRHLRRMGLLFLFGALHAVFLFIGDILMAYAAIGLLMLAVHDWPARRLLRLAGVLSAVGLVVICLAAIAVAAGGDGGIPGQAERTAAYTAGTFLEVAHQRLTDLPIALVAGLVLNWWTVAAAFCVGVCLGRTDILSHPARHVARARTVMRWGLPVGFGLSAVAATLVVTAADRAAGAGPAAALVLEAISGPVAVAGAIRRRHGRERPTLVAARRPRRLRGRQVLPDRLPERIDRRIAHLRRVRPRPDRAGRAGGRPGRRPRPLDRAGARLSRLAAPLPAGAVRVGAALGHLRTAAAAAPRPCADR